jgi:hypothetical protein
VAYFRVLSRNWRGETEENHPRKTSVRIVGVLAEIRTGGVLNAVQKRYRLRWLAWYLNLLGNPKVYYRIHKNLPLVPVLSRTNPIHILISKFSSIYFNIILTSKTSLQSASFPSGLPTKVLLAHEVCHVPRQQNVHT